MIERLEHVKTRIQIGAASAYLRHWGTNHNYKPEGKEEWNRFVGKIIDGQPTTPSSEIGVLNGYKYHIEGTDNLRNIDPQKGLLVIANHSNEGPFRGWGQTFVMHYAVEKVTGKEIVWAQGDAASGSSDTIRKSVKTIKVNSGTGIEGARNILRSLKTDAVGIFAEGKQERDLQMGDYRAGKIISTAAKNNIPIFCISSSFVNGEIHVVVDNFELPKIQESADYQALVDAAMIKIASHLPSTRQGYYRKKVEALSSPPDASI